MARTKELQPLSISYGLRASVHVPGALFGLDGRLLVAAASRGVGNRSAEEMRARTEARIAKAAHVSGEIAAYVVLHDEINDEGTVPVGKIVGADTTSGVILEGKDGQRGRLPDIADPTVLFDEPRRSDAYDDPNHPIIQ